MRGTIIVRGEHIYLGLSNSFSENSYSFQIPKSLFCLMLKKRIIVDDIVIWRNTKEEKSEEIEENKKKFDKSEAMYG